MGSRFPPAIGKEIERLIGEGRGRPTSTEKVQEFAQYLSLCRPGAERHDLDGNPVQPVSEEHRTAAQRRLDAKIAFRAQAAARASKPATESLDPPAPSSPATTSREVPAPMPAAPLSPPQIGNNGRPILKLKAPPSEAVSRLRNSF
jgi:sRNA-binding protein